MKKYRLCLLGFALYVVPGCACILFLMGCASTKQTYERGWIGGKYLDADSGFFRQIYANYFNPLRSTKDGVIPAFPDEVKKRQTSAVFVSRVYEDTPVMKAGLEKGDLILSINHEQVKNKKDLRALVDKSEPGAQLDVSVYRNGSTISIPVIVGKETYQKNGYFTLGLRIGTEFDPVPHPGFSILDLASYKSSDERLELQSPEYKYYRSVSSKRHDSIIPNKVNWEGWEAWFAILGLSRYKTILNQEIVGSIGPETSLLEDRHRPRAASIAARRP